MARDLQRRLEALGREAHLEPMRMRPAFALAHVAHAVAGIVGSVLAVYRPGIGFVIAAFALVSAFGDLTAAYYLVRRLTPVRASQNVVSDESGGKPGLVVLVAHYDSPRSGTLLGPGLGRLWARALFWSLVVIAACCAARVVGLHPGWLTVIQFIPTVVLIVMTPLLVDIELSQPLRDDTSVEAVLGTATRYSNSLEHFDLMVLLTGASAHSGLGMRSWLARHRKGLDAEATAVISVDSGSGFADREGPVFPSRMHSTLVELMRDHADSYTSRELSDAYVARHARLPVIRVSPDAGIGPLLERIDAEIGPRLA